MTPHLTDDDLVLHFYGEARPGHEAAVEEHLRTCPACQAVWTDLAETLRLVDNARAPEPDDAFEQRMWARVQDALSAPDVDVAPARGRVLPFRISDRFAVPFAMLATAAAAVILVFALTGRLWPTAAPKAPAVTKATTTLEPAARERVLLTALDEHFQRSEMLLVELMNASATGTADELRFERQTADDLVASSRLYRQSAQLNGNVRLAQMLDELELVLVEVARAPDRVDRTDLRSLRARIENDDLLFKVRAVSKQIEERQKSLATE
jgi:Zn-finger nucleic acid-binding protein